MRMDGAGDGSRTGGRRRCRSHAHDRSRELRHRVHRTGLGAAAVRRARLRLLVLLHRGRADGALAPSHRVHTARAGLPHPLAVHARARRGSHARGRPARSSDRPRVAGHPTHAVPCRATVDRYVGRRHAQRGDAADDRRLDRPPGSHAPRRSQALGLSVGSSASSRSHSPRSRPVRWVLVPRCWALHSP